MRIVGFVSLVIFTFSFGFVQGQVKGQVKDDHHRTATNLEKIQMLKALKALSVLEQTSISQQFLRYAEERKKVKCSFLILNNLAKAATAPEAPETLDCINIWFAFLDANPKIISALDGKISTEDVAFVLPETFSPKTELLGCPID